MRTNNNKRSKRFFVTKFVRLVGIGQSSGLIAITVNDLVVGM